MVCSTRKLLRWVCVLIWMFSLAISPVSSFLPWQKRQPTQSQSMAGDECNRLSQIAQTKRRPATFLHLSQQHTQQLNTYMATCIPGLAPVLAKELQDLQCHHVTEMRSSAVYFQADLETALRVVLWVRTAHKVLELLATADDIASKDDLYEWTRQVIPVDLVLKDRRSDDWLTLSVSVIRNQVGNLPTDLTHSHFTALTIKNALIDEARDRDDQRPNVDLDYPDVPLVAILHGQPDRSAQVSLYRQLHTESLHRRGYRINSAIHKAAMKESMAAGLLLLSNYDPQQSILLDPMAGSGTLLLEGALMAADLAPGLLYIKCTGHQRPPVVRWQHDDSNRRSSSGDDLVESLWKKVLLDATARAKEGLQRLRSNDICRFYGNEIHPSALRLFQESLQTAGLQHLVHVSEGNCNAFEFPPEHPPGQAITVVTNPPWDVRLSENEVDMNTDVSYHDDAWMDLRTLLRNTETVPPGSEVWILSGNKKSTKQLGWKRTQMFPLQTGQQQLRWIQYKVLSDQERQERVQQLEDHKRSLKPQQQNGATNHLRSSSPRRYRPQSSPPTGRRSSENSSRSSFSSSQPRRQAPRTRSKPKGPKAKPVENEWLI